MTEPLDLRPIRRRWAMEDGLSANYDSEGVRELADQGFRDVAALLGEVYRMRDALAHKSADLLRRDAEVVGLNEVIARYVAELKSAYVEREDERRQVLGELARQRPNPPIEPIEDRSLLTDWFQGGGGDRG